MSKFGFSKAQDDDTAFVDTQLVASEPARPPGRLVDAADERDHDSEGSTVDRSDAKPEVPKGRARHKADAKKSRKLKELEVPVVEQTLANSGSTGDASASSSDPRGSVHATRPDDVPADGGGKRRKKRSSKSLGIFAAISHPSLKAMNGAHNPNKSFGLAATADSELESDVDSTCVGSDRDVIDLTDVSEGEWQRVQEVENNMDIEFAEFQPPPPQLPQGYFRFRNQNMDEPAGPPGPKARPKPRSWRESVD